MTIATAVGLFIIPVCYVFVQGLVEKFGGKKAAQESGGEPSPEGHPAESGGTHP
jgi:hypothetical protein